MKFTFVLFAGLVFGTLANEQYDPDALYKFVPQENWAQHIEYSAIGGFYPANESELVYQYSQTKTHMRVVGTQHTFNDIADTDGIHISLAKFNRMEITEDLKSIVVGAGTNYSHLIKLLAANKVALQNMPSAPHINVAGSLITGTHGGGFTLPIISHYAEGFRYMNPRGEMEVSLKGKDADFYRKLHSFGLSGAITSVQLSLVPEFAVKKCIYAWLPWDVVYDPQQFIDVLTANTYLSFFTDWKQESMTSVWTGRKLDSWSEELLSQPYDEVCEPEFFGAYLIKKTHPVPGRSSDPVVESGVGMWHEKIYHFKPEQKPSSDRNEIQSEFFVDLGQFPEALKTLYAVSPLFREYVQITELRPVRGDTYPLSPAKGRHVMGIHFTWVKDFDNVMKAVEIIKVALKPFEYRVHWGKYFGYLEQGYLQAIYGAELDELADMLERFSTGEATQYYNKFNNCFGDRHVYERDKTNYDRCLFTHKFEVQYEKVFGERAMKDIETDVYNSIRYLLPQRTSASEAQTAQVKEDL